MPVRVRGRHAEHRGAVGLGAAIDYVQAIGLERIAAHEQTAARLRDRRGWRESPACASSAPRSEKAGVLSFVLDGVHPHDIGTILDREGIAIRAGHHCAQPVMERFGVAATARASFGLYNTREEVDALARGLRTWYSEVFG